MNLLVLDSASKVGSVAVFCGGRLLGEYYMDTNLTHSQTLMPMVDELIDRLGLDIGSFDLVGTTIGPGSFTGLRIGVSSAKSLCYSLKIPLVGVSTIKALAYNQRGYKGIVCPIMDARRSQVYTGLFQIGEKVTRLREDSAMDLYELLESLRDYEEVAFVGDGVDSFERIIKEKASFRVVFAETNLRQVRASSVGNIILEEGLPGIDQREIEIEYLRLPQAERELREREMACR